MSRHDRHRRRSRRHRQARADAHYRSDARAWSVDALRAALAQSVVSALADVDDVRMSRLFGSAAARGVA